MSFWLVSEWWFFSPEVEAFKGISLKQIQNTENENVFGKNRNCATVKDSERTFLSNSFYVEVLPWQFHIVARFTMLDLKSLTFADLWPQIFPLLVEDFNGPLSDTFWPFFVGLHVFFCIELTVGSEVKETVIVLYQAKC